MPGALREPVAQGSRGDASVRGPDLRRGAGRQLRDRRSERRGRDVGHLLGAQWSKLNDLSGGPALASFKGFEDDPAVAACGTRWRTDPGNSTPPPAGGLPSYMAVSVASPVTKTGPTIAGDTVHEVVVKTDPGYGPNPGHAGSGTAIGQIC